MDSGTTAGTTVQLVIGVLIVGAIVLTIAYFFVRTLHRALTRCSSESRTMSPARVWLLFVPFFNFFWLFWVVNALSDSLHREFTRRGIAAEPHPGRSLGYGYAILFGLSRGFSMIPVVGDIAGALAGAGGTICWIFYWMKIADHSARIAAPFTPPGS